MSRAVCTNPLPPGNRCPAIVSEGGLSLEERAVIDANKLMDQLMKSGVGGGLAGGLLSGALAGAVMGGKGNKLGKTAVKLGGTAVVAGLAYKAWQQYQAQRATRRTPRGQASRRRASIIAPRTRRSAKVSNLMPRLSSKRWAASIRPITPSWTGLPSNLDSCSSLIGWWVPSATR